MSQTFIAVLAAWLALDLVGFWVARTAVAERSRRAQPHAPISRTAVVRQLDLAIWACGLALLLTLGWYVTSGLASI